MQRGRALFGEAGGTALARVVAQGAQFAGFVAAARVLGPADFGLFALVLVASTLLLVIASAGWSERLLSFDGERSFLHSIALIGGLCAGLAILAGGYGARVLFDEPAILQLCAFFAVSMPLLGLGNFHGAILLADGRIGRSVLIQIFMELSGLVALLIALHEGLGVLALGVSKVVYSVVGVALAMASTRWLSMALPDRARLAEMLRFTRNLLVSGLTYFLQENASVLLIGAFLGPVGAGLYRAGARVVGAVAEVLGEVTRMLAWTNLRAARRENGDERPEAVAAAALNLIGIAAALALPAFIGLAFVAQDLALVLLGSEWLPSAWVIALLALRRLLLSADPILSPLLVLGGAAPLTAKLALAAAGASLLALVLAAPHGLFWAAAGQLAAGAAVAPLHVWVLNRHAGVGGAAIVKATAPALIGVAAMAVLLVGGDRLLDGHAMQAGHRLAAAVCAGGLVYVVVMVACLPPQARAMLFAGVRRRTDAAGE